MFGLRCGSCDKTSSVYVGVNENMTQGPEAANRHIQQMLDRVCGRSNDDRKLRLVRCMLDYLTGQVYHLIMMLIFYTCAINYGSPPFRYQQTHSSISLMRL